MVHQSQAGTPPAKPCGDVPPKLATTGGLDQSDSAKPKGPLWPNAPPAPHATLDEFRLRNTLTRSRNQRTGFPSFCQCLFPTMAVRVSWMSRAWSFPLVFVAFVAAQEHHAEESPPGQATTSDPIDGILWAHIFFMSLSFGILFPAGMVHAIRCSLYC